MSTRPSSITALSASHLAFMALIAVYLCAAYPSGEQIVWLFLSAGVVSELIPWSWGRWRVGLGVLLLLAAIGASYLWLLPRGDHAALHAGAGIVLAYWLLVPSRLGTLRWVLSLVIVELLWVGNRPGASLVALTTLPLGVAALAIDGWLVATVGARGGVRLRQDAGGLVLRWALLPALLAAFVGLSGGSYLVQETASAHRAVKKPRSSTPLGQQPPMVGLQQTLAIGDHENVERNPHIAARLSWTDGPDPTGLVYLRATALSELVIDDNRLSWKASSTALVPAPRPTRAPTRWAWVYRLPGGADVVLHPDGGDAVDLDGLFADRDGNLFRPLLGEAPRIYRADFDDGQLEAERVGSERYREVPPELGALPWAEVEEPRWRLLSPERAAVAVAERLRSRCTYDIEHLPKPAAGPGGVLRTFLFSAKESERRGHCQYFATSAALLLRRAGHTARCVSGFASDEFDDRGVIFRGLHAHAWIEVVNSRGRWQRFEPTPSNFPLRRVAGLPINPDENLDALPQAEPPPPVPGAEARSAPGRTWLTPILAGAALILVLAWWWTRPRSRPIDPRLAELRRQNDSLFRFAAGLGIAIGPATTLTVVTEALTARTGVELGPHLAAHLTARFGGGPMPRPWPLDTLAAAIKARRSASIPEAARPRG
jgi:transglutaminase-like putative cysteine protease